MKSTIPATAVGPLRLPTRAHQNQIHYLRSVTQNGAVKMVLNLTGNKSNVYSAHVSSLWRIASCRTQQLAVSLREVHRADHAALAIEYDITPATETRSKSQ